VPKVNDDEKDSGLSLLTRDDELDVTTSRSLHSSPIRHTFHKSKSANCVMPSNSNGIKDKLTKQSSGPLSSCEATITEPNGPPERTYKIIFIGDASVGKSTFILRLSKGVFVSQLSTTLGVDFQVFKL
jgi:Ras and EF-hand domain-containing protein